MCIRSSSEQENIIGDDIFESDGIVVDVVGRNIFWSDTGKDTIEVARLDGAHRKTIVSEGLDEPRALCVFSSKGYTPGMGGVHSVILLAT